MRYHICSEWPGPCLWGRLALQGAPAGIYRSDDREFTRALDATTRGAALSGLARVDLAGRHGRIRAKWVSPETLHCHIVEVV